MQDSLSTNRIRQEQKIYTVSDLNRKTKLLLNKHFASIWVEGEISNLVRPSSGHVYFTLKDSQAQVRCAMFRMNHRNMDFNPKNGDQVLVKAKPSLYETRGEYQLIVEDIEESGEGALRRAFDALKQRLSEEGLFDVRYKKPIPSFPTRIGVISSPTGAAIHDILTILNRRFASIPIVLFPVSVQGLDAKYEIANTIKLADERNECDVLILARGGGSLEDLWTFNEEVVARAIFECTTPVVSGIGHEIDFTIADFVADMRAATPSAAAESVSPDQMEWLQHIKRIEAQLIQRMKANIENAYKEMAWLEKRLQQRHPGKRLQEKAQRLDELELRIKRLMQILLDRSKLQFNTQMARFQHHHPSQRLGAFQLQQQHLSHRFTSAMNRYLDKQSQKLAALGHTLDTVSPLATLSRGYSIVSRSGNQEIIRSSEDVDIGQTVETRLSRGSLICDVKETRHD